jgi:hypothetical protein
MTVKQIEEILSLYQKHGWTLRRVLLSVKLKKQLAGSLQIFSETEIIDSRIDAAWFSRAAGKDREAWELRRLSETPYALFEVFELDQKSEIGEEIRREMESKLK